MNILWLDKAECRQVDSVGGKVANLARFAPDYRVPLGFCLTTAAFQQWAAQTEGGVDRFPPDLKVEFLEAYDELSRRCDQQLAPVAVRSSAVDEDGRFASFAGQYETFLNLVGGTAVADAILRCWQSSLAERVTEYRRRYGLGLDGVGLAVLVQQLVAADSSAVIFSANPVTHNRDEVVVNASWGLGESIVGGTVNPDTYTIDKQSLRVTASEIATKTKMTVMVPEGTEEVAVPRFMQSKPTLSEEQLIAMASLAIELEEQMGWPVDVESAYQGDDLYLLQCRLITTLIEPQ